MANSKLDVREEDSPPKKKPSSDYVHSYKVVFGRIAKLEWLEQELGGVVQYIDLLHCPFIFLGWDGQF